MPTRLLRDFLSQRQILRVQLLQIQRQLLLVLFQLLIEPLTEVVVKFKIYIFGDVISQDLFLDFFDQVNEFLVGILILGVKFPKRDDDVLAFEGVVVIDAFGYLEEDFDPPIQPILPIVLIHNLKVFHTGKQS